MKRLFRLILFICFLPSLLFAEPIVKNGVTSRCFRVFVNDSSVTTGAGKTGLAFNTSSLTCYYSEAGQSSATQITMASSTLGTYTSGAFKEVDATNMPGWYEFCPPDAALDGGIGTNVSFQCKGATNMAPMNLRVLLSPPIDVNAWNATVVATPDTAGYPVVTVKDGTGTGEIDTASGKVAIATGGIAAASFASGAIDATAIATDAIGAAELAADSIGASEIAADAIGASEIATDAIGAAEIGAAAITSSEFAQSAADLVWGTTARTITGTATGAIIAASFAAGAIDAAAIATDAISSTEIAADAIGASEIAANAINDSELADNLTVNITGSLSGSVGSVTGAVGSVTGAVGSVTGAVGSVGTGGIAAASFAAGAIDAAAIAADAIGASEIAANAINDSELADTLTVNVTGNVSGSVGSVTGAVGSVTGNVGGNVTGSVGSVATGGIAAGSFAAGAIDATAIAASAIGASELATDAIGSDELAVSALAEFLTTNTGTTSASAVQGSVAQETADLVSVGGGGVCTSVSAGGITAASFAAGAIDAAAIAANAIGSSELADTLIFDQTGNVSGSVGSVTGAVGSVGAGGITAASFGSDVIRIGTAQSVTSNTIRLAAAETYADSELIDNFSVLVLSATTGRWQNQCICGNVNSNDTVTLCRPWKTTPTGTIVYSVIPTPNCNLAKWPLAH